MLKAVAAVVGVLVVLMTWQHLRYLGARRDQVQDRQPLLHASDAFHVMSFLRLRDDDEPVGSVDPTDALRVLRRAIETQSGRVVYAGQAAFTRPSDQLSELFGDSPADARTSGQWDAVLLSQYPSREHYDAAAASGPLREARAAFSRSYDHGMKRPVVLNLLIPQGLLALRATDLLRGRFAPEALEAMPPAERGSGPAEFAPAIDRLHALAELNDDAVLVFNLIQPGSTDQQEANRSYGLEMLRRMAALAHGPMHAGRPVTVEGNARFEQAMLVYYPGASYFAELIGSRFFQGIIGDKQLGDTQAVATVPVLSRL